MDLIWTAFALGIVGSLHCAGMCGPLILALPVPGGSRNAFFLSRAVYHLGRLAMYCMIGAIFGLLGKTMALAGWQRWLSLAAGGAILVGLLLHSRLRLKGSAFQAVVWLKSIFGQLLHRKSLAASFGLGAINGLLPCGLVYVAGAGAAATGNPPGGVAYMIAFGLGTLPMMLGISLAGRRLHALAFPRVQKLIPVSVFLVAMLLLLRGMSLGIPYLSPDLSGSQASCPACH